MALLHCQQCRRFSLRDSRRGLNGTRRLKLAGPSFTDRRLSKTGNFVEVRVYHNGVIAMETLLPSRGESNMFLRELYDGRTLIQLIYRNRQTLDDCDMKRDDKSVNRFLTKVIISNHSNSEDVQGVELTVRRIISLNGGNLTEIPDAYESMVDMHSAQLQCARLHRAVRKAYRRRNRSVKRGDAMDGRRRVTRSTTFIYPGTLWCGTGTLAKIYDHLGESRATDSCCRDHDHCSHLIPAFSSKYNYFNYRFHTLSHCDCDDRLVRARTHARMQAGTCARTHARIQTGRHARTHARTNTSRQARAYMRAYT